MNGFTKKAMVALCWAGFLAAGQGCYSYRDLVDPCYPERYQFAARQEVNAAFAPQVQNGHVLDQTVWNYHFEPGTERLTPGGLQHLAYLARRRPRPDPVLYLQTAQDVAYDPATPNQMPQARTELDGRRVQAIQDYLNAQTAGRPVPFQVVVHDPAEAGMSAVPMHASVLQMYATSQGSLGGGAGAVNVTGGR